MGTVGTPVGVIKQTPLAARFLLTIAVVMFRYVRIGVNIWMLRW
jgi:hypothetical protein